MTQWNPSAPNVLGPEFVPDRTYLGSAVPPAMGLSDSLVAAAQRMPSTVAETIARLRVLLSDPDAGVNAERTLLAEVLAAGSEQITNRATATFRPNAEANNTGWVSQGGTAPVWQAVDEATLDTADYMQATYAGTGPSVDFEFNTAGALAGKRILGMRLVAIGALTSGFDCRLLTSIVGAATVALAAPQMAGAPPYTTTSSNLGELYLGEGLTDSYPWTVANLQALDTASIRLRFTAEGTGSGVVRVYQLYLEVDYCDENRLAVAPIRSANAGGGSGNPFGWQESSALRTPAGVANWAKANGTAFTVLVRRARREVGAYFTPPWSSFRIKAPYLSGLADVPVPGLDVFAPTLGANDGGVAALGPSFDRRALGVVLRTSAPAQSVDSQPYGDVGVMEVTSSGTFQQEISGASAQAYGGVTIPLAHDASPSLGPLTVQLRRRSDSALLATATITQAQVDALGPTGGSPWTVIQRVFAATATLAAGVQYYLAFSTTGGTWRIPYLHGADTLTVGGQGSYRDQTDVLTISSDRNDADAPVNVFVLPAALTGVAATPELVALTDPPGGCALDGLPIIALSWNGSALGGTFGAYEIERLAPDGVTWERVARITSSAVVGFGDYEARLGVQECYRMRQVTLSGIESPWSSTVCATAAVAGCGYTFTSNEAPELSVAYADVYDRTAERGYAFPEADEVQTRTMYGRDYQVAFRPLSQRGITFERRLLLAALSAPAAGVGPAAADALRELARSTLSYVTVRDESGNRWLGSIAVPELSVRQPSNLHRATLRFVETTGTPSTPDAAP